MVRSPASPAEWGCGPEEAGQLVAAPVDTGGPVLDPLGRAGAMVPDEELAVLESPGDAVPGGVEGLVGVPRTVPVSVARPDTVWAVASVPRGWAGEPAPGEDAMSAGVDRLSCQEADGVTVAGAVGDRDGPVRPNAEVASREARVVSWDVGRVGVRVVAGPGGALEGVLGMDVGFEVSAGWEPVVGQAEPCCGVTVRREAGGPVSGVLCPRGVDGPAALELVVVVGTWVGPGLPSRRGGVSVAVTLPEAVPEGSDSGVCVDSARPSVKCQVSAGARAVVGLSGGLLAGELG